MYQKFLLEIFFPSNLLEIFLGCISSWVSGVIGSSQVAPLCARIVRADYLFTADQKICRWAPLLEIRNQATLRHWITGNGSLAVRTIHEIHVYAKGKDLLNSLMYYIQVGLNRIHKRYIQGRLSDVPFSLPLQLLLFLVDMREIRLCVIYFDRIYSNQRRNFQATLRRLFEYRFFFSAGSQTWRRPLCWLGEQPSNLLGVRNR